MCIAILAKAGVKVSDEELLASYKSNKDGCGFAYISMDYVGHRKIKIVKTMDYEIFLRKYKRAQANNPESPFLIHFRIATHGTVNKFNCHPFKVNKDVVMMHNGIISGIPTDVKRSDTQVFNDLILKALPKDFYKYEAYEYLIEKFIGASKMVVLDINGNFTIYNEKSGHWKDGVWYSNYSYKDWGKPLVVKGGYKRNTPAVTYVNPGRKASNFYLCDKCNDFFAQWACNFYKTTDGELKCYCMECKRSVVADGSIKDVMGISQYRYDIEMDMENYYDMCGGYE